MGSPRGQGSLTTLLPLLYVQLILGDIMAQTSIHFQPVRGGSEEHNKREKELDYVHKERSSMNEYWQKDSQAARLAAITQNYLQKHPRRTKLHAKATPIREAVVVIEDTTTMDDLQELAQRLQRRFGIEVFQIAIHKDEGYKNSKQQLKLNLHAHLVADWTDHEKGESIKLSRQDMAEMQTICAEVLGMERGKSSDKQHLSALQFKTKAEEERAKRVEEENRKAAQELEEARAKKAKAEKAAVEGLVVGTVTKISNRLGLGAEAKALKEVPQKIEEARQKGIQEGIQEAGRRILTATGWRGKNAEKATPEDIGKAFRIVIGEQRKRADEAVAAQKQAEKAQKAALTEFQAKEEELRGQAWNWWQRAQNAENTVKERVESVIEGERAQMERKINRAERAELAALARAELFFEKLEEYWKVLFKQIEKVLDVCWSGKEDEEVRDAMDAINPDPVKARARVLKYGRALWQESEDNWEVFVEGKTERAMQLPRQWAEEEQEEEQEQQQHSRGRGWGR